MPNSKPNSQTPAKPFCEPMSLGLVIHGLGHIPAIKNSMYAIVDKKNREWKRRCVESIVSQCISLSQTTGVEIPTPLSLQSLIASLPHDDNWKVLPEIIIRCHRCPKGFEGAELLLTPL